MAPLIQNHLLSKLQLDDNRYSDIFQVISLKFEFSKLTVI